MYEAHFGLIGRPFGESVSPSAYISLPSRQSVIRRVRYGLEEGPGPVLVFGPPGTGKTLLARALCHDSGVASAHLTFPSLSSAELLALVADEFGVGGGSEATLVGG
ncbi:AAA family ATPase, partial [Singulisphaera rosea]